MRKLFFLLCFLTACISVDDKRVILAKDDMALILADFHRTEAFLSSKPLELPDSIISLISIYAEKNILKKMNLQDSVFYHSYKYYMKHEDSLSDIYARVELFLDVDIQEMNKKIDEEEKLKKEKKKKNRKRRIKLKQKKAKERKKK